MGCIVCRQKGTAGGDGYVMFEAGGSAASYWMDGITTNPSQSVTQSVWHHWVVTITTGSNNIKLYIDGVLSGSTGTINSAWTLDDNPVLFGAGENDATTTPTEFFNGAIDEVHILNTVLTQQWIQTEYANMNNPSGFVSVGSEVQVTA